VHIIYEPLIDIEDEEQQKDRVSRQVWERNRHSHHIQLFHALSAKDSRSSITRIECVLILIGAVSSRRLMLMLEQIIFMSLMMRCLSRE
jgi:hypothetical protein